MRIAANSLEPIQWKLPTLDRVDNISDEAIAAEFRKLDITAEGRLSYLNLKTSLMLLECKMDDFELRQWIRQNDGGNKGYVDFQDYLNIYHNSKKKLTFQDSKYPGREESSAAEEAPKFQRVHNDEKLSQLKRSLFLCLDAYQQL